MKTPLLGQGRMVIDQITDETSFVENKIDDKTLFEEDYGNCAVIGTALIEHVTCTVIATDGMNMNPRYPVVYAGIIGMEEGYKMASAVYETILADANAEQKRPIVLIVDTPGNGPGKVEEIMGMNKSTGAYQLALAEARYKGHPIVAVVIGRAISGAFLCHGLQADRILSLTKDYNTVIHVMPLTSISRIINKDLSFLQELSTTNPTFASGPEFFYNLGGVESLIDDSSEITGYVMKAVREIWHLKAEGGWDQLGPIGRGNLGAKRDGRTVRAQVMAEMEQQFNSLELA